MAELKDYLAYLLQNYPLKGELSDARVTKMLYLADWQSAIRTGKQMTDLRWYFHNYGPYVPDIVDTARVFPDLFKVSWISNPYGEPKKILTCTDESFKPKLQTDEKALLDSVIEATRNLSWKDFIGLVYSTHPIVTGERFSSLELGQSAREYKDSEVYKAVQPQSGMRRVGT
jgi:hypothetical protein